MPGITDGLFSARSGIQSHGIAISVLADNIANLNTTGFKQSRPDFADALAGSLSGTGGQQAGSGSTISVINQILTQGTFEKTGRGLDSGIDGRGMYVLRDPSSGQRVYSRAGNFSVDVDGNIINQNGFTVLGFPASGAGGLGALNVNEISQSNVVTNNVTISGNLNAGAGTTVPGDIPVSGSQFQDFANEAEFSTFVDVFDSLGQPHTLTAYFYHTGNNQWQYQVVAPAEDLNPAGPVGTATVVSGAAPIAMNFNADGSLAAPATVTLNTPWGGGAAAATIDLEFEPMTQFFSPSAIDSIFQDGTGIGSVAGFTINSDGSLVANLSNGETALIGTIALAVFSNSEGLQRLGDSLFAESRSSGEAVIGTPGTGSFGSLEPGALEQSTADLANDFVKLISIQRGFQGSSRVITNIDDLLNEIINLA